MPYSSRRMQSKLEIWLRATFTLRNLLVVTIPVILILVLAPIVVGVILQSIYSPRIFTETGKLSAVTVAVIPEAELVGSKDNEADIRAVAALYKANKFQKLLIAGKNSDNLTNLQAQAVAAGIPSTNVKLDVVSKRVYDMCYRLENIYNVNEALVVSNNLDLPRILFICNSLKVTTYGYYLSDDNVSTDFGDQFSHILSLAQSVWEVNGPAPADLVKGEKTEM